MNYTMNFGRLATQVPKRKRPGDSFRIAVLGDFSGRANTQNVEVGESLAARKPRRVDVDNFETICRQWNATLRLPVGQGGATVEVKIESLDDFHPDQVYSKLEVFGELSALRRRLQSTATFASAAKEIQSWPGFADREPTTSTTSQPRGSA